MGEERVDQARLLFHNSQQHERRTRCGSFASLPSLNKLGAHLQFPANPPWNP